MYPIASPESPSTTQGHDYPVESPLSDSLVELEGWVRLSESPNGIPSSDISWLKEDTQRGLFTPVQIYKDNTGLFKRRQVMKSDRMWFYPPEPPGYVRGALPTPQLFFRSRLFVWRPVGVWRRGVDRNVVCLLRDRTEGNTMVKVWRQIQENHVEEYLQCTHSRFHLLQERFPPRGSFTTAFLLAEANNVQDYRSQILSTFGTVLKMDSTKKESIEKLEPMCRGVMERFRLADQPLPSPDLCPPSLHLEQRPRFLAHNACQSGKPWDCWSAFISPSNSEH
ncbi:hypothetical protein SKAU_G00103340 [Synaphobranchus kaupii]|uniref:Uncharacterized protein n=1 Tax=Synaphobranchus kaupii TaxID=118154 RepID=A0A9Q1J7M4_SYNKA|nr:hypothetical protein SKAU_G00103340 [Synaphobranchus kaupii]